jgi:23S rRNA (cytosine1962-C5)-methyltransferase
VRLDGRVLDRPMESCPPGSLMEIEADLDLPELHIDDAARAATLAATWAAWVDAPPWLGGTLPLTGDASIDFILEARRGEFALLVLKGTTCSAAEVCDALAEASMPVVGDLLRGGLAVRGGARILAESKGAEFTPAEMERPEEKAWRQDAGDFSVSQETARAVASGHAWILPDDASDPAGRYRPGSLVRVIGRGSDTLGWAHVEGTPRLAARLWATGDLDRRSVPSVESRVAQAIARRRSLLVDVRFGGTNAFRLIHGEGDGLPGIYVDRLGPLLRVLVSGWASLEIRERVIAALQAQMPVTPEGQAWCVLELLHLRTRGAAKFERVRWIEGGPEALDEALRAASVARVGDGYWVEERGLRYSVDPGWDAPRAPRPGFGLFLDQRDNRERMALPASSGGAWLNLFAHTGAFSVSLLAAGADRVVSVDLSRPYLERLEGNLLANADRGVDAACHQSIRGDVRRYLEGLEAGETFRGIVIDPPTAAAAGRRFWSVKQDLEPLLDLTLDRLDDGGTLLVTQNRSGPALGLDRVLESLCVRAGRRIEALERAPAGRDHPSLKGFPEGDPFEGWKITLT